MAKRKVVITLAIILSIIVVLAGFMIINELKRPSYSSNLSDEQTHQQPEPILAPAISTYMYEVSGYWTRDSNTDLPAYISTVGYYVRNSGNANAENVNVTIKIDEVTHNQHTILLLAPYQEYSSTFTVTINYDGTKTILLDASCLKSSDSATLSVKATLPRSFEKNLCKLFITPNEANVVSIKNQILRDKFPLIPNWIALRDWVGNNIKYRYDSDIHGMEECWQLSRETIQLKTGDCEDYAILICSLLRADGWSSNDAYVVLGKNDNNEYHAWVKINLGILGWYNIEPQANGWNTIIGDFLSLSGYQATCYFNDYQYHTI
jgi:hypothetical protein